MNGVIATPNGYPRCHQRIGLRTDRPRQLAEFLFNSSGSFAKFAAIRRASSLVSNLAVDRRLGQHHFFPQILLVFFQYRRIDWHG
ncbi:MAG: hypothetical protein WAK55_13735 [Xanthobacteraceae bacterium]